MEPAKTIIEVLGGPKKVSEIIGIHRTRVSNWMRPREKGGTGGAVPHWHHSTLIAASDGKLRPESFVLPLPSREPAQ